MRSKPKPQEIYRHFKGKLYQIISLAEHSETGEELVIYQALYDGFKIYARPLSIFMDESGAAEYRFRLFSPGESETSPAGDMNPPYMKSNELSGAGLKAVEFKAAEINEDELRGVDPLVLEFLSAESHEKRLQILTILHPRITNGMINTMAVSLDLEIDDGEVEKRYDELRHCLMTMRKFEIKR
ncbi:MAG: DUF1653 domain-containing protein [Lachnospiraceae bacterium]|nr:DUF1653 domain-containing protein [Lachnospiraceae bacterium]